MGRRHDDADLLGLARDGSAPALASLLHRHRSTLQRATATAAHPAAAASTAMTAAMRTLHRSATVDADAVVRAAEAAARDAAMRTPRAVDVEPLLPSDWFDRAWVEASVRWPSGRRPVPRPPRWLRVTGAIAVLAVLGGGGTWLALSSGDDRDVLGNVVGTPLDGPSVLDDVAPPPEPVLEQAPELFGDVEIGVLPTYDLTTRDDAPAAPEVGPAGG